MPNSVVILTWTNHFWYFQKCFWLKAPLESFLSLSRWKLVPLGNLYLFVITSEKNDTGKKSAHLRHEEPHRGSQTSNGNLDFDHVPVKSLGVIVFYIHLTKNNALRANICSKFHNAMIYPAPMKGHWRIRTWVAGPKTSSKVRKKNELRRFPSLLVMAHSFS